MATIPTKRSRMTGARAVTSFIARSLCCGPPADRKPMVDFGRAPGLCRRVLTGTHDPGFRVERIDLRDGGAELRFAGQLRFRQCFASWQNVRRLARPGTGALAFDLSAVDTLDGAATALLLDLRDEVVAAGGAAEIVGAHGGVRAMLDLYGSHPSRPSLQPKPAPIGILDEVGREVLGLVSEARGLDFVGDVVVAGAKAVRAPRSVNWRDVPRLMER